MIMIVVMTGEVEKRHISYMLRLWLYVDSHVYE